MLKKKIKLKHIILNMTLLIFTLKLKTNKIFFHHCAWGQWPGGEVLTNPRQLLVEIGHFYFSRIMPCSMGRCWPRNNIDDGDWWPSFYIQNQGSWNPLASDFSSGTTKRVMWKDPCTALERECFATS